MRDDTTLAADAVTIMAMMEALRVAFETASRPASGRSADDLNDLILREVKQMELPTYSYASQAQGIEEALACIRLAFDQAQGMAA